MPRKPPPSARRRGNKPRTERGAGARRRRRPESGGGLPEIGVVEITAIDIDSGEMEARPLAWDGAGPAPLVRVLAERAGLEVGERAVVRFARSDEGVWQARLIRALGGQPDRVLGIFRRAREGGLIEPTDRRVKTDFHVAASDANDGELVLAEVLPGRKLGLPEARIVERIGDSADPRAFSLIAIHTHAIPTAFSEAAMALAEAARPVPLAERTDLRDVPLVTIDGADARDFDDAVWAEPREGGGWHALVAIADVSWYVRPDDALDHAARERGNSVYFPDRVVPMLPEALSNELCSLKPGVERACLAATLDIDEEGRIERHRFVRGLMRSAARLTYEEAQAAIDTNNSMTKLMRPLHGVYRALDRARLRRGALELDLPERRILLDPAGRVARIEPRARLDSHKLIEELMIAANVAAAETLERNQAPCMYRIHDQPDPAKLAALREFLASLGLPGLTLAKGQVIRPRLFNEVLRRAADTPYAAMINQLVLRSQAQAVYGPSNLGHFGLGLRRYAHFTSPIRRYSDLLVHRSLVSLLGFGAGGLAPGEGEEFAALGEHVSMTERRAAAAERSAADRYLAAFLAERTGAEFPARINGVTRAGLFITLAETGADGLIPMRSLPGDYYQHDEAHHRLIGRRTRKTFTLGDSVTARLAEANTVTGSLLFSLVEERAPARQQRR